MLAERAALRASGRSARYGLAVSRETDPVRGRCSSVLSELWHAEPGCGANLREVQLPPQGCRGPEVQGNDADDESARSRGDAGTRCGGSRSGTRPSDGTRARRSVGTEQAQGNHGGGCADGHGHAQRRHTGAENARAAATRTRRGVGVLSAGPAIGGGQPARGHGRGGRRLVRLRLRGSGRGGRCRSVALRRAASARSVSNRLDADSR